jgi:titin
MLNRRLRSQPRRHRTWTLPLRLDFLEDRLLLSTYMVTNTNDSGPGSLRQAIMDSNGNGGPNVIDFSINSGQQTIIPRTFLPAATTPVTIDGTSQPGYSGTPLIELDGASEAGGAGGLTLSAGSSTVKGFVINRFSDIGIDLGTSSGNHITGNYIGTDTSGRSALPNRVNGIVVHGSNNTIGGTTAADRNIISGNGGPNVLLLDSSATGNVIEGNYVGTDVTGTRAVGGQSGVAGVNIVHGANHNTIGGTSAGARNVISGSTGAAVVFVDSGTNNNLVEGNYIGTTADGTAALANADRGLVIQNGSSNNTIGGTDAGARNVISGNTTRGIDIFANGTSGNQVLGNYIGTTADGTSALPNGDDGVAIDFGASANTVGGTDAGAGNLISGNLNNGVEIFAAGAANNQVLGNHIGTDVSGISALPNHSNGVAIENTGASANTVGGAAAGAGNLLSGNLGSGVSISGGASDNVVLGNRIGTDISGATALANQAWGVVIGFGAGTSGNTVGGTSAVERNVISGNQSSGILLGQDASANVILGNYIGTDVSGSQALPNQGDGVTVGSSGASNNTIGGTADGAGNLISGNTVSGVSINSGATGNQVLGNRIGTDVTGSVALANQSDGVPISGTGTSDNTIGGTGAGTANVIAGNAGNGVGISAGATGNQVLGNMIGTDVSGTAALANRSNGVSISSTGTSNNTVGGVGTSAGNLIAGNAASGVSISGGASDNQVLGNRIGTDVAGTTALANQAWGVVIAFGAGTSANTVGGTSPGERNVISGNRFSGVFIGADARPMSSRATTSARTSAAPWPWATAATG